MSETLDEAWAAAEAALPEGWRLRGLEPTYDEDGPTSEWEANASGPSKPCSCGHHWHSTGGHETGTGPTPAAALQALAAALRSHDPAPTSEEP